MKNQQKKEKIKNIEESLVEIKTLDQKIHDLYFGETIIFPSNELRQIWDNIRTNEKLLGLALMPLESNIVAPHICSLILMEYENVDPLAYKILTNLITNHKEITFTINPFLEKYKITLLATLLFNNQLQLSKNQSSNILNMTERFPEELRNINTSIDTRYWVIKHPLFINSDIFEEIYPYEFEKKQISELQENYIENAKLRTLTKVNF